MHPREHFIGTIIDNSYLLTSFLGEGAESVVYGAIALDGSIEKEFALKLFKPVVFLEMDSLHHSLRVDEARYPNHPLLLSAEERLTRLTNEMLELTFSPRCEFRVSLYRTLMDSAISGITSHYAELYEAGQLESDFLSSNEFIRLRIDDNFLGRLKDLLDEDMIVEPHAPFVEYLAEAAEAAIKRWKTMGCYHPVSSNQLYNLLGLWIEGFINIPELDHIASDPRIAEKVSPQIIEDLWRFATGLYHRAVGRLTAAGKPRDEGSEVGDPFDSKEDGKPIEVDACVQACRIASLSLTNKTGQEIRRLRGLTQYWKGKALNLLPGTEPEVREAFVSSLAEFDSPECLPECLGDLHDLLFDLAILEKDRSPNDSLAYIKKAMAVRDRLGLPPIMG